MTKIILGAVALSSMLMAGPADMVAKVIDSGGKAATDVVNASSSKTVVKNSTIKTEIKTGNIEARDGSAVIAGGMEFGKGIKIDNSTITSKTNTGNIKATKNSVVKAGHVNFK